MEPIKVIKIDSINQTITEETIIPDLPDFYKHINCSHIEAVYHSVIGRNNAMYVDEEGLLKKPKHLFKIGFTPIAGNGVVFGVSGSDEVSYHDEDGDLLETLKRIVKFICLK